MTEQDRTLRIAIVSDVVCPWCIIGFKQLEAALAQSATEAAIDWHPFELNPHMPSEGENLRQHLAAKYGTTPEEGDKSRARLTGIGEELGFAFRYTDDMRVVNTFRAHQLLEWAKQQGRQHDLKLALFSAFFTEHADISDAAVLSSVAASIGLDGDEAQGVLRDGTFAETVRQEERFWQAQGISGVPAMIFDERYLVTGAQGVENYTRVIEQVKARPAA